MKHFLLVFSLFCLYFLMSQTLVARHIVGGDMYYECLGNNDYKITMIIYRDCASTGANVADYDDQAAIGIYNGSTLVGGQSRQVSYFGRQNIPPDLSNPCLIPPSNVCVEKATYEFTVNLPSSAQDYTIVYQRCCRNNTITNIITPGDVGATYNVTITPQAHQACNSSPTFDNFPPIVICNNAPIDFDHAATDADGDQLVYSFCAPLQGGGNITQGAAVTGFNGVSPDPPSPPSYNPVNFGAAFSGTNPMGGSPQITIDPTTGFISGIPTNLGQYVVGVCVQEFRNGVLLSTTRRDFQFNVANCEPTVVADVSEDFTVGVQEFVINSCGNNTIDFINQSFNTQFIQTYYWEFDMNNGSLETATTRDVTITFPDTGLYRGIMIVNEGLDCGDTAEIFVNIYPDINSEFSFIAPDPCENLPVQFTDLSTTEAAFITDWYWEFGDGGTSTDQNPSYLFTASDSFLIALVVTDNNGCQDTSFQEIAWFPTTQINVAPTPQEGCEPLEVEFINNSFPVNNYAISWDFGDGATSTDLNPIHTYQDVGTYIATFTSTSPIGCIATESYEINVYPTPTAGFTYSPRQLSNFNLEATFTDVSVDSDVYFWDFGTGAASSQQNPTYEYPDTGVYVVNQIVTNSVFGCQDTAQAIIDIIPLFTYFLPNAFTPNADGSNDGYRGQGVFFGLTDFEMTIYNRWGEMIFLTNDPNEAWNGRKNNTGVMSKNGVYVCTVTFKDGRGERYEYEAFATLIR